MATNKHAVIRYNALDKCFRNTGRRYYLNDLLEACNNALCEFDSNSDGIKKRQLFEDIRYMEKVVGESTELLKKKDGKEVYYRYENPDFSINNKGLNATETAVIKDALLIISRFKNIPKFEWVQESITRMESTFKLKGGAEKVIGFDENLKYDAVKYISALYNAIINKQTLKVTYKPHNKKEYKNDFYPYYLKEYNNRWFCFGSCDGETLTNFALDRIVEIKEIKKKYIDNIKYDFEKYFKNIVGVTVKEEPQKIILKVALDYWPYIESKPLHGSQKEVGCDKDSITIRLDIGLNYELESLILSHGEKIEVLEPVELKKKITERASKIK